MHGTVLLALLACGSPAPEPSPVDPPKPQKNCRAFDVIQGGVKRRLLVDENGMPCEEQHDDAVERLRTRLDACAEYLEDAFVESFRASLDQAPAAGVDAWEKQKSDELTKAGCAPSEAP